MVERAYRKGKFSFMVVYIYYMCYILISLCAKTVPYVILFGEIICKEIFYFIFTYTTAVC